MHLKPMAMAPFARGQQSKAAAGPALPPIPERKPSSPAPQQQGAEAAASNHEADASLLDPAHPAGPNPAPTVPLPAPAASAAAPAPSGSSWGPSGWADSGLLLGLARQQCSKCRRSTGPGERFLVCGDCRKAAYCSGECQSADWRGHRLLCYTPGTINHADDGIRALLAMADRPRRIGQKPQATEAAARPMPPLVDPVGDQSVTAGVAAGGPASAAVGGSSSSSAAAATSSPDLASEAGRNETGSSALIAAAGEHGPVASSASASGAGPVLLGTPVGASGGDLTPGEDRERPSSVLAMAAPRSSGRLNTIQALADSFRRKMSLAAGKGSMSEVKDLSGRMTGLSLKGGQSTDDERVGSSSQGATSRLKSPRPKTASDASDKPKSSTTTVEVTTPEDQSGGSCDHGDHTRVSTGGAGEGGAALVACHEGAPKDSAAKDEKLLFEVD